MKKLKLLLTYDDYTPHMVINNLPSFTKEQLAATLNPRAWKARTKTILGYYGFQPLDFTSVSIRGWIPLLGSLPIPELSTFPWVEFELLLVALPSDNLRPLRQLVELIQSRGYQLIEEYEYNVPFVHVETGARLSLMWSDYMELNPIPQLDMSWTSRSLSSESYTPQARITTRLSGNRVPEAWKNVAQDIVLLKRLGYHVTAGQCRLLVTKICQSWADLHFVLNGFNVPGTIEAVDFLNTLGDCVKEIVRGTPMKITFRQIDRNRIIQPNVPTLTSTGSEAGWEIVFTSKRWTERIVLQTTVVSRMDPTWALEHHDDTLENVRHGPRFVQPMSFSAPMPARRMGKTQFEAIASECEDIFEQENYSVAQYLDDVKEEKGDAIVLLYPDDTTRRSFCYRRSFLVKYLFDPTHIFFPCTGAVNKPVFDKQTVFIKVPCGDGNFIIPRLDLVSLVRNLDHRIFQFFKTQVETRVISWSAAVDGAMSSSDRCQSGSDRQIYRVQPVGAA